MALQSTLATKDQIGLLSERRYLVLFLPTWPTDYLKRHDPDLADPLALYERIDGGLRLAAVDASAAGKGLRTGQNLADARALLPNLTVREIDRSRLFAAFADFVDWHSNASPLVAVLADTNPLGDLVLDITGVAHLFGGEAPMLGTLLTRLRGLGYSATGAVASTIGAAWATSHYAQSQVVSRETTAELLDALPVAALRLEQAQVIGLMTMGLKRISQIRGRDHKQLQARFGAGLIRRLDQAYGFVEERMTPRLPQADHYVERRFPDPISLLEDVLRSVHELAVQLADQLISSGSGAQTFHLFLYRVDHKVMTLSVSSGSPTRAPDHMVRLLAHRSERLREDYDAGFGIEMIRLAAASLSQWPDVQSSTLASDNGAESLNQLCDRISARLGTARITHNIPIDTHIPEQAMQLRPVLKKVAGGPSGISALDPERPLRLLPAPEAIAVIASIPDGPPASMKWRGIAYRLLKASGPERIGAEWWRSHMRLKLVRDDEDTPSSSLPEQAPEPDKALNKRYAEGRESRDYYIVEDEAGKRFWLFREGLYGAAPAPSWFMHGVFP